MRIVRKSLILAVGSLPYLAGHAQSTTQPLGVCSNSTKIACLLPFVTRVANGTATQTVTPAGAQLFNGPIAAQLSQLPSAVSAPGVAVLYVNGNPQAFDNLGPILLDRPDSVGQGKLVFGASFQQYHFNHIDGVGLNNIPLVYAVSLQGANPTEYLQQTEQVSLKFNQFIMLATYGLPKKFDVSVVVPYSRISISAADPANIPTYQITQSNTLAAGQPGSSPNFPTYLPGVASGIGDVSLNLKRVLWTGGETGKGSLAAGFAVRLPTGDALNYLGSGAYGYNLYGLASYKARISPHVKYGYQWNSTSVLLNVSQVGTTPNLPGGSQFAVGADAALSRRFTASVDLLANQFVNAPYINSGCITIPTGSNITTTATCGTANTSTSVTLPSITSTTRTYTTANASMGVKWRPLKGMILYGNVLIQVNDVGLRSYPSPSGGISYSFNTRK